MWRSGENLLELVVSIYHVGSSSQEDQTQVLDVVFFYPPPLVLFLKQVPFTSQSILPDPPANSFSPMIAF